VEQKLQNDQYSCTCVFSTGDRPGRPTCHLVSPLAARRVIPRSHLVINRVEINLSHSSKPVLRRVFPTWSPGARSNPDGTPGAVATLLIILEAKLIIQLIWSFTLTMPHFGKSKSPTDIPDSDSTQTPPVEPVQDPTLQRASRALGASSTATGAAFYDARQMSSDGAAVRGSDTSWQTPNIADYRVRATSPTVIITNVQLGPGPTRNIRENKGNPQ
jgi:hypothetical protein